MNELLPDHSYTLPSEAVAETELMREARNLAAYQHEALAVLSPERGAAEIADLIKRCHRVIAVYDDTIESYPTDGTEATETYLATLKTEQLALSLSVSEALLTYTKNGTVLPSDGADLTLDFYSTLVGYTKLIATNEAIAEANEAAATTLLMVVADAFPQTLKNPQLVANAPHPWRARAYTHAVAALAPDGTPPADTALSVRKRDKQLLEKISATADAISLLSRAWSTDTAVTKQALTAALEPSFGKAAADILDAWNTCTARDPNEPQTEAERIQILADYITQNLESLTDVWRATGPEGVMKLHDTFGIRHFGRYPSELLVKQAQHKKATHPDQQYVVVLYPFKDPSGAFYNDPELFSNLAAQLQTTHAMVFTESAHRHELLRRLLLVYREYSGEAELPADMILLGGHGNEHSMEFGTQYPTNQITKYDFKPTTSPPGIDRLIRKDAPIILASCSTGAPDGLAEWAAGVLGRPITAPDTSTGISDIDVVIDTYGHIREAYPQYTDSKAHTFHFLPNQTAP